MLGVKNRFAALKVDDDENDGCASQMASSNQNYANSAAKKKNKKKKKEADEALRSMAFGMGRAGGKTQKSQGGQQHHGGKQTARVEDWEEWQRRDTEATEDMYQRDLQQALLDSKLEDEEQKQMQRKVEAELKAAVLPVSGSKDGKKKRKKDKPQAMSLDQFKQLPLEKVIGSDEEIDEPSPSPVYMQVPSASQDTQYFENVASTANRILQKERIQEQYQKAYAHENVMKSKYEEQLEKKDKKIAELRALLEEQGEELKTVKKRSSTLCRLLAQGEMKDKADVLMHVDELSTVKDELTEQVASLTAELEKERSKVHCLKSENEKLKIKHGK